MEIIHTKRTYKTHTYKNIGSVAVSQCQSSRERCSTISGNFLKGYNVNYTQGDAIVQLASSTDSLSASYGLNTLCPVQTYAPSLAPTPAPTFAIPIIPYCNITIFPKTNKIMVQWVPPLYNNTYTPSQSQLIRYLIYDKSNDTTGVATIACCAKNFTLS